MKKPTLDPETEREFEYEFTIISDWNNDIRKEMRQFIAKVEQRAIERERERIIGIIKSMGGFPRKGNLKKALLANIDREWFGEMAKFNSLTPPTTNERKK